MPDTTNQERQNAEELNIILHPAALEAFEQDSINDVHEGMNLVLAVAESSYDADYSKERIPMPWAQEPGTKVAAPDFYQELTGEARNSAGFEAQLQKIMMQATFEAMHTFHEQYRPEPDQTQQDVNQEIQDLIADMPVDDIVETIIEFMGELAHEQQQQHVQESQEASESMDELFGQSKGWTPQPIPEHQRTQAMAR